MKTLYTLMLVVMICGLSAKWNATEAETAETNATVRGFDGVVTYRAVICGVSDYPGYDYDLSYCDDDARDVRDALLSSGNWQSPQVVTKIDSAATKSQIRSAIQQMAATADADDVCVVYFSGHGTAGDDVYPYDEWDWLDEYLVPYNGIYYDWLWDESLVDYANCISDDEISEWMAALPTRKYVVVLDTCFSGGHVKALGAEALKGIGHDVPLKGDGFAADFQPQFVTQDLNDNGFGVVLTACDDDEYAQESVSLRNGVFTYYLVQAIAGLMGDVNGDRRVSAEESYAYAKPRATTYNPGQHAQIYDSYPGELTIVSSVPTLHHFAWSNIYSQYTCYPFSITITAKDANGYTLTSFTNAVVLSGYACVGSTGRTPVASTPTSTGSFKFGVWTGLVTVLDTGSSVLLRAQESGGSAGESLAFNVAGATPKGTPTLWLATKGLLRSSSPVEDEMQDADGDGMLNWEEYVAGTMPNDGNSVIWITDLSPVANSRLKVSFQSIPGKVYGLWISTNLLGAEWTASPFSFDEQRALQTAPITAVSSATSVYVQTTTGQGFFRVAVLPFSNANAR